MSGRARSDSHDGSARAEYNLFKAECKSICYDEVRSLYGQSFSNQKITTTGDYATVERLVEKFPCTDLAIIELVSYPFRTSISHLLKHSFV